MGVTDELAARVARLGSVGFDDLVELALYGDHGFYTAGAGAGRRGDFITSPEVGPLFGAVLARALDEWWHDLGRPDPYVVVEAGAGRGALASAVLASAPACAAAVRYVCVERSPGLRRRQGELLSLEPASEVFGAVPLSETGEPAAAPGGGPLVTSLGEMPALRATGVVVANELLDNLPFRLLERGRQGWAEVHVGFDGDRPVELAVPATPDLAAEAGHLAPDAPVGGRVPLQHRAADWVRGALGLLERGRLVVVDYADTTPSLATRRWDEWLRTYRGHGRGGHALEALGEQDITCEVAVDQLARVAPLTADRSQAEWLRAHGLGDLVDAARATWHERAHLGDLPALRARSRVGEADALTDASGLGAFRVLEWVVGEGR